MGAALLSPQCRKDTGAAGRAAGASGERLRVRSGQPLLRAASRAPAALNVLKLNGSSTRSCSWQAALGCARLSAAGGEDTMLCVAESLRDREQRHARLSSRNSARRRRHVARSARARSSGEHCNLRSPSLHALDLVSINAQHFTGITTRIASCLASVRDCLMSCARPPPTSAATDCSPR